MINEDVPNDMGESALLQQTITPSPSSNFDQVPIGGGNKFAMSEYPSQNEAPPPTKKIPIRKTAKPASKKQQLPKQNEAEGAPKFDDQPIKSSQPQPLDELPVGGNKPSAFDEKPIGKSDFNMSQFPDEAQPVQTNYTMMQKLKSKAAKMRLSGMQDLLKLLEDDPDNPQISEVQMAGLLKQTTPANLEKIAQCLKIWVQKSKEWGEDEVKNAIENGYINGKTNSRKITVETIDLMYEQKPAIIQMLILNGLKNKTPKIIAGYNQLLNQILAIYGIKKMNYLKPYIPEIVRVITNEKLPAVKTQGLNTLKEAYMWLGKEVVEPMLNNLKEGLKKELDTFWEAYDKTVVKTAPKQAKQEQGGKGKGKKVDAYDLSEAVDVFKKFNQKWAESVLKAEKWNERTKLMQQFIKGAAVPKFANTEFRHVSQVIRRLINDSNFNVVLWDLKLMGAMSKGLRKNFAPVAKSLFSNVLSKFRDKKTLMVQQTFKTLNDLNYCLGIEDVMDDVKEGLNDKAPNMRCNLLNWVSKHVEQKAQEKGGECPEKTKEAVRQLFSIFQKLMADGVAQVRQTMAKNLGKMQLVLGEQFFSPIKSKLNKTLVSKIVQNKPEPKKTETNKQTNAKKSNKDLNQSTVTLKTNVSTVLTKKMESQKANEKEQTVSLQSYQQPNFDECLNTLIGLGFPQEQVKNVTAAGAKQRASVLNYMKQNPYQNFNAVLRVLRKAFKDWKQVNLMMNKDLIAYIEQRAADINKQELYVLVPYIVQKIGDSKFSQSLYRIVANISKRVPGRYLIGHIIKYIRSTEGKKPKLNGDVCVLLIRIIQNISMSNCSLKELVDYGKETYAVSFSRKGAVELLNFIYSYVGDPLKAMLDEPTLKGMQNQFTNVKPLPQDQKKPKVQFEGEAAAAMKNAKKAQPKASEGKVRDLSAEVQQLMPKLNDNANWQNRKNAAESLCSLIEQSGRVTLGNLTDFLATLKTRINDPNKQLIKVFVHLTGVVVCALPQKDVKANMRSFITALVQGLNDKNELNKKEIHLTLNKIADNFTKEQVLSYMGPFLEGDREGRLEVINLILNLEEGLVKADLKDYPRGLVNCLSDKNKDIRAGAEKLFEKVYEKIGIEIFRSIAKDQKIAVAKDLNTFLDKFDKQQTRTMGSIQSKGTSPNKDMIPGIPPNKSSRVLIQQQPLASQSAKKRSVSKYNPQKSFIEGEDDPHAATTGNFFISAKTSLVEGNQNFANLKILTQQRAERQSAEVTYIWRLDQIKQAQQQTVREDIEKLIRVDLAKKLLSFDYKRVLEGTIQIIKLCKDVSNQGQIRQIYDILLKFILLRLWGGNPGLQSLIELLPPLMSILEKKGIPLTDFQVDLSITIIRQYFISASMVGFKVSESLYSIITCLIALSSGVKVLKKILRQFTLQLNNIHKHLKTDTCLFYREGLSRLIKTQLIDYVGNEDLLEQTSKIKELKDDPEFVQMLYRRLHSNVLDCFGFKRLEPEPSVNSSSVKGNLVQVRPNIINNVALNQVREKSSDHLPPRGHTTTNTMMELRPSALPPTTTSRKSVITQQPNLNSLPPPPPHSHAASAILHQNTSFLNQTQSQQSLLAYQNAAVTYQPSTLDLSVYPAPHHACPLGKQLGKLLPPNDSTINFFNSLFTESGQKIVNQLAVNAKIIFGSILKSVQEVIAQRRTYAPDRIVAQITLFQNCIKCPHVVKNIGELLGFGASFALNQLVYEDQNKASIYEQLRSRNIEYKSDNFIKAVNGVMLRLLENANSQDIVNVLLELLTNQYKTQIPSPKLTSLIIKCLGRVSAHFNREMRPEATRLFLNRAINYLFTVQYETPLEMLDTQQKESTGQKVRLEDSVANSIKCILIELCKAINSQIWQYYEKAMSESQYPDRYISSFINFLNVRPIQKNSRSRSQQKQNEQLKKINELLSKTKSFEVGIVQLKKYISLHPQFNPLEYFTSLNYDHKFISMVISAIDGLKQQRKTPVKDDKTADQNSQNIQDKIKKLKQKFQQLQPEGAQQNPNTSMNRGRPATEEIQNEERAQEIRRRIEEMKNKMSTNVNRSKV